MIDIVNEDEYLDEQVIGRGGFSQVLKVKNKIDEVK